MRIIIIISLNYTRVVLQNKCETYFCIHLSINTPQVWPLQVAAGSCLHVWLPGMERPEALFASVVQLESRSRGVRLADVELRLRISCDAEKTQPPLKVTGLWLHGAHYDRER
jgi:hypothetical protein